MSCIERIDGKWISKDTEFAEDIKKLKDTNLEFAKFYKRFNKFNAFADDKEYGIKQWANNIKHQGGFYFSETIKHVGHSEGVDSSAYCFLLLKYYYLMSPLLMMQYADYISKI